MLNAVVTAAALLLALGAAPAPTPLFASASIGNGITLHYVAEGRGRPVIFVHGSLSDYDYWEEQVPAFAPRYRAIAYSRRYDFPNVNPPRNGYSAITDADDLARFIQTLRLGKVDVIGHSYGAFTALLLAIRHPGLVRSLVLAEPPVVSLLPQSQQDEMRRNMVEPMRSAFLKHDDGAGIAVFMGYVFHDPRAWQKMSPSSHAQTLRDARKWEVMMTRGTLFPYVDQRAIRDLRVPVLLMTGTKTYPFLTVITRRLAQLLPNSRTLVVKGAGHQMWLQQPQLCRNAAEAFFR